MKEKCHFNQREKTIHQLFPSCFFLHILIATTTCILLFTCKNLKAQQKIISVSHSPKTIIAALDSFKSRLPIEKLYLQTDKPYYTQSDTIWFKSYLLNADFLTPSERSGLLYVELDNSYGQMVKRIMVPAVSGISWGDIALNEMEIPEGSYTLRAYTNWMRNFGEDYIFKKDISISSVNGGTTLVKAGFKLEAEAGKNKITAGLQLTALNGEPIRFKDMRLRVSKGYGWLFSDKVNTGMDGRLHLDFNLADNTAINKLTIQIQNIDKGADTAKLLIPLAVNRPEKTDVQFMPEGGNLMAGIAAKVGFKAISEDGKGLNVNGKVYNSKQQEVAVFQTTHKGMGSFTFTPQVDEIYTAKVDLPDNITKNYPLPLVKNTGTGLSVTAKGQDSLEIILNVSPDLQNTACYLIGQSREVVCYAAQIVFKENTVKKTIAKGLFPTGIAHFILLTNAYQPLNERLVYIDHNDNLRITLSPDKPNYKLRDSISLAIEVHDKDNKPVHGTFSLAVTDNDQVKYDTVGSNIINNLLFTSDLKGTVEEPEWFFESPDSHLDDDKTIALDNLMLTQGWVGYDWKQIVDPAITPQFRTEKEFTIQGKLTNILNKPLKKADVSLMQKQPLLIMDTITNNEGRFIFESKNIIPTDSTYYLIEAKKKDGENKTFNTGVEVDEPTFPQFTATKAQFLPWYFNVDTTLLNNVDTKMKELNATANYKGEGNLLKEVVIKAQKIIPGSHNLNGPGGADVTLDEKDMNKEKNYTLFEVLQHRFKDFHKTTHFGITRYFLDYHGNEIRDIVMNGVFISYLHIPKDILMEYLTAIDIKGIEVMTSGKYALIYPHSMFWLKIIPPWIPGQIYLEITTYSGVGASFNSSGWKYVYKPTTGFSLSKEFYRPRYSVKNSGIAPGTDLRSTIHWEPNVITDKNGKATVSFFSADKPADYTVIMEGTDLNGSLGYQRKKIRVNSNTVATK